MIQTRAMRSAQIGEILLQKGKLSRAQLEEALARRDDARTHLGALLVRLGYASSEDVAHALAEQLGIPYFDLGEDFRLERDEVKLIPEAVARRYGLIPVKKTPGPFITVVMRDPIDADAIDAVRSITNLEVHKAVSTEEKIVAAIDRFYREDAHLERNIQDIVDLEEVQAVEGAAGVDADQLRVAANDAPVIRFVNLILMRAIRDRASDIHFEPEETSARVRLRVDGCLREVTPPPKALYQAIVTRIKILSNMDIGERRLPLDGRFKFKVGERVIDVRVSSLPEVFGEKLVLRILDRASLVVGMREIGFEDGVLGRFQAILKRPHGIVLLTGPTGSGKTTTLYSALSYLRSPDTNIQTVEDPVEYLLSGINQMQVREKIGLDFAGALRAILRQDPDIIMIGEIRDVETARIAMRAALTGHLVLSTLHTNDAPSAFSRLRDIGIESYLVAATVNLVISQRLVRRVCDRCKQPFEETPENVKLVASVCPDAPSWTFVRGAGCEACGHTGYRGRIALVEFLEVDDAVRTLVAERADDLKIRTHAVGAGMEPLVMNGCRKIHEGMTTVDEVVNVWPMADVAEVTA